MKRTPRFAEPDIVTPWTPWRRLMAKTVLRAVLDIVNHRSEGRITGGDPVAFLQDQTIRDWSDAWGLSIPWRQIDDLSQ